MTSDFNPAITGLDLSIPAVIGIMSHLVGTMLAEADSFSLDTKRGQEQESPCDEVTNSLVANNATCDSLANLNHDWVSLVVLLSRGTPEGKLDVGNIAELGVRFVLRIDEMLDLGHGELSYAQESLTRRDLVSETKTDLGRCEGSATIVVFN
mgnify:CR=1 FL=1